MRNFDVFFDLCMNKCLSKQCEAGDLRRHGAHYDVIGMWHSSHIVPAFPMLWKKYDLACKAADITDPFEVYFCVD